MKRIEIKENEYLSSLVMMVVGMERLKVSTPVRLLVALMERSNGQYVVLKDVREDLQMKMVIRDNNWRQIMRRLEMEGHLSVERGVCYFAIKYCMLMASEGNVLVSIKKVDKKV